MKEYPYKVRITTHDLDRIFELNGNYNEFMEFINSDKCNVTVDSLEEEYNIKSCIWIYHFKTEEDAAIFQLRFL